MAAVVSAYGLPASRLGCWRHVMPGGGKMASGDAGACCAVFGEIAGKGEGIEDGNLSLKMSAGF